MPGSWRDDPEMLGAAAYGTHDGQSRCTPLQLNLLIYVSFQENMAFIEWLSKIRDDGDSRNSGDDMQPDTIYP